MMPLNFFVRNRYIFLYATFLALLLLFLNWLKLRLLILDHALEVYIGSIAIIFTGLGIWLALKLTRTKTGMPDNVPGRRSVHRPNMQEIEKLNLTRRELEVLQLMAEGLTNQEIAARLFLSVSTIKTHCNNLFDKMEVKRRTQAIEKARRLGIIGD